MCSSLCGRYGNWRRCCYLGPSPMTEWERLKLSPFQKWQLYGLPPWKCFISVLLVITTTIVVYMLTNTVTPYYRAQSENWEQILIPVDGLDSYENVGATSTTYYVYTVDEFEQTFTQFVNNYYSLNYTTVGTFKYINDYNYPPNFISPIQMTLTVYQYPNIIFDPSNNDFNEDTETTTYYLLNGNDYGPFNFNNQTETLQLIHSMKHMSLEFDVQNLGIRKGYKLCYIDTVTENWDFYYRGRIDVELDPKVNICEEQYSMNLFEREYGTLAVFLFLNIFLAIVQQSLSIKAVIKHIAIFRVNIYSTIIYVDVIIIYVMEYYKDRELRRKERRNSQI